MIDISYVYINMFAQATNWKVNVLSKLGNCIILTLFCNSFQYVVMVKKENITRSLKLQVLFLESSVIKV